LPKAGEEIKSNYIFQAHNENSILVANLPKAGEEIKSNYIFRAHNENSIVLKQRMHAGALHQAVARWAARTCC
jgi:hypothetical protein